MTGTRARAGTEARAGADWAAEVRRLAARRDAVILAHNYQDPEIQDVADHVGDSLGLSRLAAASTASVIVFAGVYFMAETAKILAPDRTVLIPEPRAGCSLADSITAQQVTQWKAEHPGAVVVAYVNTSAEVKAESDLCCTSANAAQVVASVPADREVLFLPDQFLGAYVRRVTGRANMRIWLGECHVHAGISPADLRRKANADGGAELFIHPECGCSTAALWQAGEGDLPAAVGEAASTGVHGANRLASNSLTEALITGRRAGERLGRDLPGRPGRLRPPPAGSGVDAAVRSALAAAMTRDAGVVRDRQGLRHLQTTLAQAPPARSGLDLATVEATNLHAVSVLVAASALARAESRGCHRWRDAPPVTSAGRARHTLVTTGASA
jgi:Quinolinate synthetase A protein/Fumarate reductase flavoprotein C-term